MNAPADATASKVFREGLRAKRVALRSAMHQDDIDDVEILASEDLDVAATREVLKVDAAIDRTGDVGGTSNADGTDEVALGDVLEVIAIGYPEPQPLEAPRASAEPFRAPREAWPAVDEDDAFLAHREPISTCGVTFDLEAEVSLAPEPRPLQRRLRWVVGTVMASCIALLLGEAIASGVSSPPAAAVAATAALPATTSSTSIAAPSIAPVATSTMPTVDVSSLPAALVGKIIAPASGVFVVDGKRMQGGSVLVSCGKHIVKTPHKKAHPVTVPCGGQIVVP